MRFPGLGMDKSTKQTFIGGITGSLAFFTEQVAYEQIVPYPTELKGTLTAGLPRNGQLLATAAPLGVAWVLPKVMKRRSELTQNLKVGITAYSAPKLIQQVMVNAMYEMGKPVAGLRTAASMGLNIRPNNVTKYNNIASPARMANTPTGTGKYRLA